LLIYLLTISVEAVVHFYKPTLWVFFFGYYV
jgi:hypothetical protein